jgi:large subunit ribosomal protein L6
MSVAISTSRIGRKPITVPSGVDVKMKDGQMAVKGPKGQLTVSIHPYVNVTVEGNEIKVHPNTDSDHVITGKKIRLYRSIAGTVRANIFNVIHGVTHGFERTLQLVGVGYKAQSKGKVLSLNLGYSHPTDFAVPEGVVIETPTPTDIIIKGACKELVGSVASKIRAVRSPEPYKGKGVRYANEVIELKETKKK